MVTLETWWLWLLLGLGFIVGFALTVVTTWASVYRLGRQDGYQAALNNAREIERQHAKARLQAREDRDA